jgi:hypothetical protein
MQSKAEDAVVANPGTTLQLGSGDWTYIFTQKGPWGHLPGSIGTIAQLTAVYALASELDETARGPILDAVTKSIRLQAQSLP